MLADRPLISENARRVLDAPICAVMAMERLLKRPISYLRALRARLRRPSRFTAANPSVRRMPEWKVGRARALRQMRARCVPVVMWRSSGRYL